MRSNYHKNKSLVRKEHEGTLTEETTKSREKPTLRSIIIGLMGVLFLSTLNLQWVMLRERYAFPVEIPLSILGMSIIFVLLGFNVFSKKFLKNKLAFKPSEMIVIYSMVIFGGLTVSARFLFTFIQYPISLKYSAMTSTAGMFDPLLDTIAKWLIIEDTTVVGGFIAGMSRFGLDGVPWDKWIIPLLGWASFYIVFFITLLCVAVMIRKRWQEQELVNYPLTYPVLEAIKGPTTEGEKEGSSNIAKKLFFVGVGITTFLMVWQQIAGHSPLPAIPEAISIPQLMGDINPWFYTFFRPIFHPALLGILYLVPSDIIFSAWVFILMGEIGHLMMERYTGLPALSGVFANPVAGGYARSAGGMTVLSIYLLWLARAEISLVFRKAFAGSTISDCDDTDEPVSYRTAAIGFISGVLIILLFQVVLLKMPLTLVLIQIIGLYSVAITMARIRAESGIPRGRSGLSTIGSTFVGARHGIFSYYRGIMMPVIAWGGSTYLPLFLENSRLAYKTGLRQRDLTKVVLFAFLVSLVVGTYVAISQVYSNNIQVLGGLEHATTWWKSYTEEGGQYTGDIYWQGMVVFWGLFTLILGVLRARFVGWPFTPTGFVIGSMQEIGIFWFAFFIIWLTKLIIFRYAGPKLYTKLIPLAMGLVIGYIICVSIFTIIGLPPVWVLG